MNKINFSLYKKEAIATIELGLPIVISQLGIVAMGVADMIQVGQIVGKGAVSVSASGLSNSLIFTFAIIGVMALGVIAPMISKADAEKKPEDIKKIYQATIRLSLYIGIITAIITCIFGFFFHTWGQEPEVVALAVPFNTIVSFSAIPLFIFCGMRQLSDGLGKTKLAMFVTLSAVVLNIFLNWVLINGKFGFPRLELFGTGIATFTSRIYMAFALWILLRKEPLLKPYMTPITDDFKPIMRKMIKIGLPSGLQGFFEVGVFAMAVVIIGWYGKYQQAAHLVAISICSVFYMMVTGVASAGGIRVGHFWGLHDKKQILIAGKTALGIGTSLMVISALIFVISPSTLIHLYTDDVEVIPIAVNLLIIGGIFQLSDGLQASALGILRGIADVNIPTLITLFSYWIFALPIGYLLAEYYDLKAYGIWLGLTVGLTASAVLLSWRFFTIVKRIQ